MNYQSYSSFDNRPASFGKPIGQEFYDRGLGIPPIDENNITVQDIYRTPFLLLQEHRKNYKNMVSTALKGIQCNSELSTLFFSDKNIKRLQKMIRRDVFQRTNGEFRLDIDQDVKKLLIAMRAIYMTHARFLPGQIVRQCKRLNKKVIDEIIPGMITEIRQYYGYLKEINKPLDPIPRPLNVSNKGRLTLPSVTTVWSMD